MIKYKHKLFSNDVLDKPQLAHPLRFLNLIVPMSIALAAFSTAALCANEDYKRPHTPPTKSIVQAGEPNQKGGHYSHGQGRGGHDHDHHAKNSCALTDEGPIGQVGTDTPIPAKRDATIAATTLILYDSHPADNYGKLGKLDAIMLYNLLGHFSLAVDLLPIESYTAGKVENYTTTFYIGDYYDNAIPTAFLTDVMKTAKRIVWFKYNIWQLATNPAYAFTTKFGMSFIDLVGLNATPTAANPNPGFFDTVIYKGKNLIKYYAYDAPSDTVFSDPDIGEMQITNSAIAKTLVTVKNGVNNQVIPYIIQSGNFWYYADSPFSYIGARDRYLVLCDILHDILGINHATLHQALVRLEDVGALVDPTTMKTLTDYMFSQNIPFSIATIPFYRDPLGTYNNGVSQEIHMKDAPNLLSSLKYAATRGGSVVMHGYTHQYDSLKNPWTGVSADDFEFWNTVANTPVAEDSGPYALGRLSAGIAELAGQGYTPFAWEAPHYQASATDYRVFPQKFKTTYQRAVYYSTDVPILDPNNPNRDFDAGMFFPYIINQDYYGQRILPENLGNVEYDISAIDPISNINYPWTELNINAQYGTIVRDGYASFFFHPFWLEKSIGTPGFADFKKLVQGINASGYKWVAAKNL